MRICELGSTGWKSQKATEAHSRGALPAGQLETYTAGIQRLMRSAECRPGRWLITNDEVAAHVAAFPNRSAGVAAVDLANPMAAVRELVSCPA